MKITVTNASLFDAMYARTGAVDRKRLMNDMIGIFEIFVNLADQGFVIGSMDQQGECWQAKSEAKVQKSTTEASEKTKNLSVEFDSRQHDALNSFMLRARAESEEELINKALEFYDWAVTEIEKGNNIVCYDPERDVYKIIQTKQFEAIKSLRDPLLPAPQTSAVSNNVNNAIAEGVLDSGLQREDQGVKPGGGRRLN